MAQLINNLIANGSFTDGTTGWSTVAGTTLSIINFRMRVARTTGALVLNQACSYVAGRKYYVRTVNVTTDMTDFYIYMGNFVNISPIGYTGIITPSSSGTDLRFGRAVY